MNKNNFDIDYFRLSIAQEALILLDFSYLAEAIEAWWEYVTDLTPVHIAKFQLIHCCISYLDKLAQLDGVLLVKESAVGIGSAMTVLLVRAFDPGQASVVIGALGVILVIGCWCLMRERKGTQWSAVLSIS